MANKNTDSLIDLAYEAAVLPEFWPRVLDRLAEIAQMKGGVLFAADQTKTVRWIASEGLRDVFGAFVRDGWMARNSRAARLAGMQYAGFVADRDLFTHEQMDNDPLYRDFLRPNGLGWGAGTIVPVPSGNILAFTVEGNSGAVSKEAVRMLDRLRPHLVRAGLVASRLDLRNAQAMSQALQTVGLPAAVLRRGGRVYAANPLFERLMPDVLCDRRERLVLANAAADALFAQALATLGRAGQAVQSIPLAATGGRVAMIVHLLPVCGAAHDVFSSSHSIVVITPVDRRAVPTAQMLQGLFDLTPAEARVARCVGEGQTLEAHAVRHGLSLATVRVQLKAVMAKTGVHRQAELAALLAGATLKGDEG